MLLYYYDVYLKKSVKIISSNFFFAISDPRKYIEDSIADMPGNLQILYYVYSKILY